MESRYAYYCLKHIPWKIGILLFVPFCLRPLSCWKFCEFRVAPKTILFWKMVTSFVLNRPGVGRKIHWLFPVETIESWEATLRFMTSHVHSQPNTTTNAARRLRNAVSAVFSCVNAGWIIWFYACIWLKIVWKECAIYNTAAKAHVYFSSIAYMLLEPWIITSPCSMCTVLIWSKYWGKQNMILSTIRLWVFKFKQKHVL